MAANLPLPKNIKYIYDEDGSQWTLLWDTTDNIGFDDDFVVMLDDREDLCIITSELFDASFSLDDLRMDNLLY